MKYGLALPCTNARSVANMSQLAQAAGWDGCFLGDAICCAAPDGDQRDDNIHGTSMRYLIRVVRLWVMCHNNG